MSQEPIADASAPPLFQPIKPIATPYAYRSIKITTYLLLGLCGCDVLAQLAQMAVLAGQRGLLEQMTAGAFASRADVAAAAAASDGRVRVAATVVISAGLACYVVGSAWIYRAARNIRGLGAQGLQISPGWAVGSYAVPFLSLIVPFQAMEEIDAASAAPTRWSSQRTALLLRFWWGGWLIAGIVGYAVGISGQLISQSPDLASLIGLTDAEVVSAALSATAAALFGAVVWRVYRAQARTRAGLKNVAEVFA